MRPVCRSRGLSLLPLSSGGRSRQRPLSPLRPCGPAAAATVAPVAEPAIHTGGEPSAQPAPQPPTVPRVVTEFQAVLPNTAAPGCIMVASRSGDRASASCGRHSLSRPRSPAPCRRSKGLCGRRRRVRTGWANSIAIAFGRTDGVLIWHRTGSTSLSSSANPEGTAEFART